MTPVPETRRWVAFRAYAAVRILEGVQGALEDVEGAVEDGQLGVAAYQARVTVLLCLSVRSLERHGEIHFDAGSVSFDFFAGLPEPEVASGLALAREALELDERNDAAQWLERLRGYVNETEALLGDDAGLPVLRSPEGPFGMIAVTRRWCALLEELGLPTFLQGGWRAGADEGA